MQGFPEYLNTERYSGPGQNADSLGLSAACGLKITVPFDQAFLLQKLQILCHSVHTHLQGRGDPLLGDGVAVIYEMVYFALIYLFDFHCGHAGCHHEFPPGILLFASVPYLAGYCCCFYFSMGKRKRQFLIKSYSRMNKNLCLKLVLLSIVICGTLLYSELMRNT